MICRLRQCSLPITIENGWSSSVVMLRYQSRFGFWRHNWMRSSSLYLFEKFEPSIRKGTYEVLTWYRFTRNWKSPGKKHSSLTSSEQEKIVNVASNSRRWRSKFLKLQFRFWIFNFTRSFPKQIILAYFYFQVDMVPGGHLMEPPCFPIHCTIYSKLIDGMQAYGGEPSLHGYSQYLIWERTIKFFKKFLGEPPEMPDYRQEMKTSCSTSSKI